jgi:hypothetical protein
MHSPFLLEIEFPWTSLALSAMMLSKILYTVLSQNANAYPLILAPFIYHTYARKLLVEYAFWHELIRALVCKQIA